MKKTQPSQEAAADLPLRTLKLLAGACFLFALFVALRYAGQFLSDLHSFRQTQTALTSYWFIHE